ncbi:hypothetical protein AGRA3207_007546 [Actinomadura graeca]|uniref:Uncharacterized protein n=1 Tax=Actinomadura graeca TaxID=2750812 RepID=A0ABX8R6T2_9ACTN|nr:hypothetical protein [Actinomadura graeca]QXJ25974.1 hypothetical protein AGRA3207_007546 [Actinomadura graeca]
MSSSDLTSMTVIPVYGRITTAPIPEDTTWLFTRANRLEATLPLTHDPVHGIEVVVRHGTAPNRHRNCVAEQLITFYTGTDQPVTGLAVLTAADARGPVTVPSSVTDRARVLAESPGPGSPTMAAISPADARAQRMLAVLPPHTRGIGIHSDLVTDIAAAIGDLLSYAAVLAGPRNHATAGVIIGKVIAAVADQAREDMAAILLPGLRAHAAPGFQQEAAWAIGELITQAQRRRPGDPHTSGFTLLREAVIAHMLNAPFTDLNLRPERDTITGLGDRLAELIDRAEAELGPDGPLALLCHALNRPAAPSRTDQE